MRIQNTRKNATPSGQKYKSTLRLPASKEVYETLKLDGPVVFRDGYVEILISTETLRDLKASVNSWLRMYETLMGVEKKVEK